MSAPENTTLEQREKAAKLRKITAAALSVAALILLVWDFYAANNDVRNDTISELLRDVSYDFWALPFMLMGVMGHLFWNRPGEVRVMKPKLLVGACVLVGIRDVIATAITFPSIPYANLLIGVLGFVLGAAWWPQLRKQGVDDGS